MTGTRKYLALFAGFVLAAVLGGVVSQAMAAPPDPFSDIGSSVFHDEIINIAGAGIATGFPDGTFRPRDPVNRQQFAAWMNRGGGRVNIGSGATGTPLTAASGQVTLGQAIIQAGAVSGTGGFVVVTADLAVSTTDATHCPCRIGLDILPTPLTVAEGAPGVTEISFDIPGTLLDEEGRSRIAQSMTRVYPIGPNEVATYDLRTRVFDANVTNVTATGNITALYVPFSAFGGN